ncbi:MAG TPA: 30S ribosomal protein S16 [Chthoniobacterales bacterium]|nr:30S ribosomal protein S16 [Chthoniobacterales bacterium]
MAVSIRLRREGARNRPYYKVVVADSRSPRDGKFIEILGTYDPKKPDHNSTLQLDRIEHWISKGAQPSDTVRSLIKKNKKQSDEAATPDAATSVPSESARPVAAAAEPSVDVETPAPTTLAEETAAASESAAPTAVAEESKAPEDEPSTPPPLPS